MDRPSNPDARFELVKLADSSDQPEAITLAIDALEDLKTAFAAKFPQPEALDPIAARDQQSHRSKRGYPTRWTHHYRQRLPGQVQQISSARRDF